MIWIATALVCAAALIPTGAAAQASGNLVTIDAVTDLVERGLSATDGRAAIRAAIGGAVMPGLRLDASAVTLRGGGRNGGADAGIDMAASYRMMRGAAAIDAGIVARLFPGGAGGYDYVEMFGGASALIGPAEIGISASYAPDQAAIGGDNLYLRARARAAVIGTPVSLIGHVGRSSGAVDDPVRATRLRPDGRYVDWSAGAEYARGPLTFSVTYADSDAGRPRLAPPAFARHGGARFVAGVAITF